MCTPCSSCTPVLLQEALHMNVATLHLMHAHGLSRQQVAALARESPTLLRSIRLQ